MSKQDKEQDRVLLTVKAVNAILDKTEHKEDAYNSAVHELLEAQLAKAREAVKGAGLTDEEIQGVFGAGLPLWEYEQEAKRNITKKRRLAEAQTNAILKALGGE